MVEEETGLVAGFTIEMNDAFGQFKSLDDLVGETVANATREWKRMENMIGGGVGIGRAAADMHAFGATADRELRNVARAEAAAEKSAEALTRKIQKQTETFGLNASQIRNMNAEMRATEAEALG